MVIFTSWLVILSQFVATTFTAAICDGFLGTEIDDKLAGTLELAALGDGLAGSIEY